MSDSVFEIKRYLVVNCEEAETKRHKKYVRMKLTAIGGQSINGVCWEPKKRELLKKGVVADIIGDEEESPEYGLQLNVKGYRESKTQIQGDEFLPKAEIDVNAYLAELDEFIINVTDDEIRYVLKKAWEDPRWRRAPAAQHHHHAYLGGLLEHVVNLCRLADAIAKLYPFLRRDLLIAGAVLHDIGKMDEMSYEQNIDYTDQGQLLGHIVIGYEKLLGWAAECLMPPEKLLLLKHVLLSHHGTQAFGSPKSPQIIEAQVFCDMDGLDAHIGSVLGAMKRSNDKEWTDKAGTGQRFFLGKKNKETI